MTYILPWLEPACSKIHTARFKLRFVLWPDKVLRIESPRCIYSLLGLGFWCNRLIEHFWNELSSITNGGLRWFVNELFLHWKKNDQEKHTTRWGNIPGRYQIRILPNMSVTTAGSPITPSSACRKWAANFSLELDSSPSFSMVFFTASAYRSASHGSSSTCNCHSGCHSYSWNWTQLTRIQQCSHHSENNA